MKRLSEYVAEAEQWVESVLNSKLVPSVKVVVVLENGLFSHCMSNDPFVEVSVHHFDGNDFEAERIYRQKRLQEDVALCPYPPSTREFGRL